MKINNNIKKGEGKRSGTVGIHTFEEEKKKNNLIALCLLRLGNPTGYSAFGRYTIFCDRKKLCSEKEKKTKVKKKLRAPFTSHRRNIENATPGEWELNTVRRSENWRQLLEQFRDYPKGRPCRPPSPQPPPPTSADLARVPLAAGR